MVSATSSASFFSRVVDGAGADDDENPRILVVENGLQGLAALHDDFSGGVGQRHAGDDFFGGGHAVESRNVQVLGLGVGHGGYASENAELNILPRSAAADCAAGKAKHGS